MAIATYWDQVYDFSASEAAHLILGMEPEEDPQQPLPRVRHLLRQMNVSFIDTCGHFRVWVDNPYEYDVLREEHDTLRSEEMWHHITQCSQANSMRIYREYCVSFLSWMDTAIDRFAQQRFSRDAIDYWVELSGVRSQYVFANAPDESSPAKRREKARELLTLHQGNKSAVAREMGISRTRVDQLLGGKAKARKSLRTSWQDPFNRTRDPEGDDPED